MPRQFALLIFVAFVIWLFARDRKLRPMTSGALWIPLLWLLVITSRPVSLWFGGGLHVENPDDYLEGSPFDRNVYLLLMAAGWMVLFSRRLDWGRIFRSNWWLIAFFLFCGLSVLWSDYAFVALKRWIKDLGNVAMVLIILTEKDLLPAIRAFFARCTYITVPFSVLVIKYYGEVGRYLTSSWENAFCGIATEKNALGFLALLSGIFLVWDYVEVRSGRWRTDKTDKWTRLVLMLMVFWLIDKADSSTALVCLFMGSGIVLMLQTRIARRWIRYLGTCAAAVAVLLLLFVTIPGLLETFLEMLGEDMSLTGRTELWGELMQEKLNPLLGTGYQSFWLGPRAAVYWEKWSFHPNQAHNGYLETYLNTGLIGVALLLMLLITTARQLRDRVLLGGNLPVLFFSYFVVIIFYNWTEAMFNKMSPVWFLQILASTTYPSRRTAVNQVRAGAQPLPPEAVPRNSF